MTLYGTPRDTPAPDDAPSHDEASALPSMAEAAYVDPPAPRSYRGARRAPEPDDEPMVPLPREPVDPLMSTESPRPSYDPLTDPHWSQSSQPAYAASPERSDASGLWPGGDPATTGPGVDPRLSQGYSTNGLGLDTQSFNGFAVVNGGHSSDSPNWTGESTYTQEPSSYEPEASPYGQDPPRWTPEPPSWSPEPPAYGPEPSAYGEEQGAYGRESPTGSPQPPAWDPDPSGYAAANGYPADGYASNAHGYGGAAADPYAPGATGYPADPYAASTTGYPANPYASGATGYPADPYAASTTGYPADPYASGANGYPADPYAPGANGYPADPYASGVNAYPADPYAPSANGYPADPYVPSVNGYVAEPPAYLAESTTYPPEPSAHFDEAQPDAAEVPMWTPDPPAYMPEPPSWTPDEASVDDLWSADPPPPAAAATTYTGRASVPLPMAPSMLDPLVDPLTTSGADPSVLPAPSSPLGQPPPSAPPLGQPPLGQPPLGQPPLGQPPLGQPAPEPLFEAVTSTPDAPTTSAPIAPADGAPTMGQPATASRSAAPDDTMRVRPDPAPALPDWTEIAIPGEDDQEIAPWDRKPLMIVIAAGLILVLIGILAGVASEAIFDPGQTVATWHPAGSKPGPGNPAQGPK